jgi:hypothetical protein
MVGTSQSAGAPAHSKTWRMHDARWRSRSVLECGAAAPLLDSRHRLRPRSGRCAGACLWIRKRRSTGALQDLADARRAVAVAKRFGVRRCRAALEVRTSSAPPVGKMRCGRPVRGSESAGAPAHSTTWRMHDARWGSREISERARGTGQMILTGDLLRDRPEEPCAA